MYSCGDVRLHALKVQGLSIEEKNGNSLFCERLFLLSVADVYDAA
jgi:hypothetical protein